MESDYVNALSDVLRRYRKEHDLSVAELASLLSVSRDCLSNLERGVNLPNLPTLRALTRLFEWWTYEDLGVLILNLPEKPHRFTGEEPREL